MFHFAFISGMYTVEFQKRRLPHAHISVWLSGSSKLITGKDIDRIISTELPDPKLYPKMAEAVKKLHDSWSMRNCQPKFSLHEQQEEMY